MEKPPVLNDEQILHACKVRAKDALWRNMTADEKFRASSQAIVVVQRDADVEWYTNKMGCKPLSVPDLVIKISEQIREQTAREIFEEIERFSEKLDAHHTTGISSFLEFLKAKYL